MQKLIKVLEDMMVAITFAEAGEYDEAKKITMNEQDDQVLANSQLKTTEA